MKKYFLSILILMFAALLFAQYDTYVVIDPMHGGKDSGAVGYYQQNSKTMTVYEKDVALKIAKALASRLQKERQNAEVCLTRDRDVLCSKKTRHSMFRESSCGSSAIYIAIGTNLSTDKSKRGFTVCTPSYAPNDFRLANAISEGLDYFIGEKMENQGLAYKQYKDGRERYVVVELGFLSNRKDAELLAQDKFVEKCVEGLLVGIKAYMKPRKAAG